MCWLFWHNIAILTDAHLPFPAAPRVLLGGGQGGRDRPRACASLHVNDWDIVHQTEALTLALDTVSRSEGYASLDQIPRFEIFK